jgi:hypothetical protein
MDGEEKSCDKMSKRQSSKLRRAILRIVSMSLERRSELDTWFGKNIR